MPLAADNPALAFFYFAVLAMGIIVLLSDDYCLSPTRGLVDIVMRSR